MNIANGSLLQCKKISKQFKGVKALDNVDFVIRKGVVQGLVGENGAGKSTLMKIISGVYSSDQGEMQFHDRQFIIEKPEDALENKIITIYQDSDLIPTLTVAENVFLNREPTRSAFRFINTREVINKTSELLSEFNIHASPHALVRDLPNDIQKMIQIVKSISREAEILLMDEPTSSLTKLEAEIVLNLVRVLADKGVGIVFISHYLSEVFQICDSITILRDGKVIASVDTDQADLNSVVELMIGGRLNEKVIEKEDFARDKPIFSAQHINVKGKLKDINFSLNQGEVLGVTGLIGSGCSELAKTLFQCEDMKSDSGCIILDGEEVKLKNTEDAVNLGMALITNDRKNEGLLAGFSLCDNICLPSLKKYAGNFYILDNKKMLVESNKYIDSLRIKTPDILSHVESLSGGNQQKVLFAKWLETGPRIFIMDEPTIGIDVGAKYEIRRIIKNIALKGVSVILITAELEELVALCDRVLVMFRGEIIKTIVGDAINKQEIIKASMGD